MFRSRSKRFLYFFLTAWTAGILSAQAEPQITSSIDPQKVTVGESLVYEIKIEWDKAEGQFNFALPSIQFTNLSLLRQGESEETARIGDQDRRRKTFSFILAPVQKGEGIIHPLNIPYVSQEGLPGGTLKTPEYRLAIKGGKNPSSILLIAIGSTAAIGISVMLSGFLRKRSAKHPVNPEPEKENPSIVKLRQLFDEVNNEDYRRLLSDASSSFRSFLAETYGIPYRSSTEIEMLSELQQKDLPREELTALTRLLNELHNTKFTGSSATRNDFDQLNRQLIAFIEGKKVRRIEAYGQRDSRS